MEKTKVINECFHAYGVHSTTLQPEPASRYLHVRSGSEEGAGELVGRAGGGDDEDEDGGLRLRETGAARGGSGKKDSTCVVKCSGSCEEYACCD